MHVAIVELLRCPVPHAESPLVAAATRQQERRILAGSLGCPVCGTTYEIAGGIADFGGHRKPASGSDAEPNDESTVRLAAQLDLTETGRLLLLFGRYARLAPALSVMFDAQCIAVNAAAEVEAHIAEHASVLRISHVVPLAAASMHGVAVDAEHATLLAVDAVRGLLRPRGRLVAPASVLVPSSVELLARDDSEWVGVRASERIQLERGRILK
jgi:uncharacterized protein YbaR (Trm112 family)